MPPGTVRLIPKSAKSATARSRNTVRARCAFRARSRTRRRSSNPRRWRASCRQTRPTSRFSRKRPSRAASRPKRRSSRLSTRVRRTSSSLRTASGAATSLATAPGLARGRKSPASSATTTTTDARKRCGCRRVQTSILTRNATSRPSAWKARCSSSTRRRRETSDVRTELRSCPIRGLRKMSGLTRTARSSRRRRTI